MPILGLAQKAIKGSALGLGIDSTILGFVKPRRTAGSGNLITFLSQLTASEQGSRIATVVDMGNPGLNGESQLVLNGE